MARRRHPAQADEPEEITAEALPEAAEPVEPDMVEEHLPPPDEPGEPEPESDSVAEEEPAKPEPPQSDKDSFSEPVFAERVPEPPTAAPAPPPPAPRRSGGGFWLALVALVIGLGAGYLLTRDGGPLSTGRLDKIEAAQAAAARKVDSLEKAMSDLKTQMAALPQQSGLDALSTRIGDLNTRIEDLSKSLDAAKADRAKLTADIADLSRPKPDKQNELTKEAVTAYETQLAAMRKMFQGELDKIKVEAQKANTAAAQAADAGVKAESLGKVADIKAALDTGKDLTDLLDQLHGLDSALPVDALRPYQSGVPTLAQLQAQFPSAARAALAADAKAGTTQGGVTGFLRAQLGMRSLSPKQGDSTDAILSRAQAALDKGDLKSALAETDALDGPAANALAAWRDAAQTRQKALAAYDELAAKVQK